MTPFSDEAAFEQAVIDELTQRGWEKEVLRHPDEHALLNNWAKILYENNREMDCLNNCPLTDGEMQQIMEQITALRTPVKLNSFINGKTVAITRDNQDDTLHFGREVSLKIYNRQEIAAGQSRYQIVQQPRFARGDALLRDRRGDLLLLINGMPVIHLELKKSGVAVSRAYHQIEKYSREGLFSGIFSLIQIFVAMEPEEALFFANPGPDVRTFNKDYAFHWADFNNEPINHWKAFTSALLSIPMAHQLIGYYTVADESDGVLKVMRSYQYYAAHAISDKVAKTNWRDPQRLGGFIWHTTGSGKTMTSFKSAQLIACSQNADNVVFLVDRIELGTQSLQEYRGFAGDENQVQATEDTGVLISKLKSHDPANTLIVTSIQKMSRVQAEGGIKSHDLEKIRSRRIVFIIDECHRSTFGDMLIDIKNTFTGAVFFGFSGTPIHKENTRKDNTTADVFGPELHRYSIADGIRDKNVLGFDPYQVKTYKDMDVRRVVALNRAKAVTEAEAMADAKKNKVYRRFMDDVKMAGYYNTAGEYQCGIEDDLPNSQYSRPEHQDAVVQDISDNWVTLSRDSQFHAIFATHNIREAITYYRLLKRQCPSLNITALFDPNDPNVDNDSHGDSEFKTEGLKELLADYKQKFGLSFDIGSHGKFKKDIAARLAHKRPYTQIASVREQQLDLLIVVDQMLTGYDSKWVNTLYMDKVLKYENIIQAFSRTNRLHGPDKPFGTVRYYRRPHTMKRNVDSAVKLYSGDKPAGLFANRLPENIRRMNAAFAEITAVFVSAAIPDFRKLPDDMTERAAFAKQFQALQSALEAARIQGFVWEKTQYPCDDGTEISPDMTWEQYLTLLQRYKELSAGGGGGDRDDVPFDIDSHISAIDTGKIDADYMNTQFRKFLKVIHDPDSDESDAALKELQRSYSSLSQDDQRIAEIFIRDLQRGEIADDGENTFHDYLCRYKVVAKEAEIREMVRRTGVDEDKLKSLMNTHITEDNLNDYSRFDALTGTIDTQAASAYFQSLEGRPVPGFKVRIKATAMLRNFVLQGGFSEDEAGEPVIMASGSESAV